MLKKNHLYLLILFFVCLFSRIFTSIYYIEDIDSLRFAFSLYDYDITKLQPHFPGYPVFCFIAKLIYVVTGSMGITVSIIGGVSVYYLIYFMLKLDNIDAASLVGLFMIFIIFFNPLVWLMSNRYMPDIMGLAIVTAILYQLIFRSKKMSSLYCGYFLSGVLAGIRLSYLPIILFPFISELIKNKNRLNLLSLFLLGIFLWLIPLIWITGFDNLWLSALNHTQGHFMDYGGSIFTEKNLSIRFFHLVESIWADGMGGYWLGRSWVTVIFSFFILILLIFGFITIINNWKFEKSFKIIMSCILIYLLWVFLSQNIIYKSRHILPALIVLFIMLSVGYKYIVTKHSPVLYTVVLLFIFLLIQITRTLVWDHKNPSAIAQLKNDLIKNDISTIVSTPLINYYMKSNSVSANFINIDNIVEFDGDIKTQRNESILMIGNFESLFIKDFIVKKNMSYYHNPYVNRMWSQIDTYYLIHKTRKK